MWRRLFAALIDGVILLIGLRVLQVIENTDNIMSFWTSVFYSAYYVGAEYFLGGSIGKRLLTLRVACQQGPAVHIIFALLLRAAMRGVALAFYPIWALLLIWRADGLTIDDFFSGTYVVDAQTLHAPQLSSYTHKLLATLFALACMPVVFFLITLILFGQNIPR